MQRFQMFVWLDPLRKMSELTLTMVQAGDDYFIIDANIAIAQTQPPFCDSERCPHLLVERTR